MTSSPRTPYAHRILTYAQSLDGGGVERAMLRLASGWVAAGRQVTMVVGRLDGPLARELPEGLDIVELGSGWYPSLRVIHRYIRDRDAQLLFCPGNHYTSMALATRLRMGADCPPIVAKVSNALNRRDHRGLMIPAYRLWLRRHPAWIDHFVAMTAGMRDETIELIGAAADRVSIIPNPPTPVREDVAHPKPPARRYLIGVGRLEPQKRWDRLIAALPRLADSSIGLMIVGEGAGRGALQSQIDSLGLTDRVAMPGYVTDPSRLIAGAEALVLTSDFEGVPNVLREALSLGTPIVSTESSVAVREIISRPEWGNVIAREDGDALVRAIDRWLAPDRVRPVPVPQPGADAAQRYLALFDGLVAARALARLPATDPLAERAAVPGALT